MFLFFDLETTGLPKSFTASFDEIDNWPRVVQIAWMIFDPEGNNKKSRNFIIFPKDFEIPSSSTAIHGISLANAEKDGIIMNRVLDRFNDDLMEVSTIIAHNLDFDLPTLNAEF